jgi:hypothetical protein
MLVALDPLRRNAIHPPIRIRWTIDALAARALGTVRVLVVRWAIAWIGLRKNHH